MKITSTEKPCQRHRHFGSAVHNKEKAGTSS
jgi:hypothetical protein